MTGDWHEETTDPSYADAHNFYKVEQWDIGDKIGEARLVYASSNLQRVTRGNAASSGQHLHLHVSARRRKGPC
jgi:hypothetical protein